MIEVQGNKQRRRLPRQEAEVRNVEDAPGGADHPLRGATELPVPSDTAAGTPTGADSEVVRHVREIVRVPAVTRVPKTPASVEGVANLRGTLLPIINLRCHFGMPPAERNDDMRAVVVEADGRLAGLVVDRVSEVIRVPAACIEPPPATSGDGQTHPWLQGVAKLCEGQRLILLLDVDKLIPSSDVTQTVTRSAHVTTAARQQQTVHAGSQSSQQVVTFHIDGEEYALPVKDVQEIIRPPEISRIPHTPGYVEGVASLRDRVIPIVNLRTRFAIGGCAVDDDSRVVVVNVGAAVIGMQVDAVSEVLNLPADAMAVPPALLGADGSDQLLGVAKLDKGRRLIMLLDANRILPLADLGLLTDTAGKDPAMSAAEATARRQIGDEQLFVGFRIEGEEFGVPIQYVQEIIWLTRITRVPRTPPFVEGIINLRGNVLPVIDLRKRFGLPSLAATESTSIIVVDVDGRRSGVIVDAVSEVRRLALDSIEPPPAVTGPIDSSFVTGIGKCHGGSDMIIILDLAGIVAVNETGATA